MHSSGGRFYQRAFPSALLDTDGRCRVLLKAGWRGSQGRGWEVGVPGEQPGLQVL